MSSSLFQEAPRREAASQMVNAGPPTTSTFFSLPPELKPMKRLSGDQNG
jgi:hypothetical protein